MMIAVVAKRHGERERSGKLKKAREPQKRPPFSCTAQQKSLLSIMAVIQETNDDIPQQQNKEVVVNTNIAESEAEESEVDEEHEENNEEGKLKITLGDVSVCIHALLIMYKRSFG